MTTITIHQAEKNLAALLARVRAGEEIVISDGERPGVKLSSLTTSYRGRGALKGKIKVTDEDLFEPLPDEEIARWWGENESK